MVTAKAGRGFNRVRRALFAIVERFSPDETTLMVIIAVFVFMVIPLTGIASVRHPPGYYRVLYLNPPSLATGSCGFIPRALQVLDAHEGCRPTPAYPSGVWLGVD